jgi:Holliday junction resolvase-like predicted endonuclease
MVHRERSISELKAEALVTQLLEDNGYKVTNANATKRNNPLYDLICEKPGVRFYVDVKGYEKGTGAFTDS